MVEEETNYDDICKSQELGQVIFSGSRNFTTSLTLCENVYGNLIQIESKGEQQKAIELMKTSSLCVDIWTEWWDENNEGNWVSAINSSKHLCGGSFQSWARGEPNGDTLENCASLQTKGKSVDLNYGNVYQSKLILQVKWLLINGLIDLVEVKPVLYVT